MRTGEAEDVDVEAPTVDLGLGPPAGFLGARLPRTTYAVEGEEDEVEEQVEEAEAATELITECGSASAGPQSRSSFRFCPGIAPEAPRKLPEVTFTSF